MLEANLYELREKYQRALREKNIEESIISGIAYYQAYRNGIPLEEDREKIQNDIFNALAKEDPL